MFAFLFFYFIFKEEEDEEVERNEEEKRIATFAPLPSSLGSTPFRASIRINSRTMGENVSIPCYSEDKEKEIK